MLLLRTVVERVMLLLFGVAQGIFVLQGVSTACAAAAVFALYPPGAPAWLRSAIISTMLVSGTYFIAGVLIFAARRWRVPHANSPLHPGWSWKVAVGLSLLILPVHATFASSGLLPLWRQISAHLAASGFWDEWAGGGSNGAMVLIPIFLALYVPAQVTTAAAFSIAFPLSLMPLLAARSRLFPTLLVMGAVCQTALVLASWLATGAFARLAGQALASMAASGDAEVLRLAGDLDRATGVLTRTAAALMAPLIVTLAGLAFLRPSSAAAAYFTEGADPALAEASRTAQSVPMVTTAAEHRGAAQSQPKAGAGTQYIRLALAAPGVLMLMFAAADGLRTRASYVSSQPEPGVTLRSPPTAVRITLDATLDPASSLSITKLVSQSSLGAGVFEVETVRRLAPDDPERRTLEGVPTHLAAGLYRVNWTALPAGGGVPRHGSYSFGVGAPVPADTKGTIHSLQDRDSGARNRHTVLGGVLLLVLGALLPRFSSRTS